MPIKIILYQVCSKQKKSLRDKQNLYTAKSISVMVKPRNSISELVNYMKNNLKKGYTKESLKWALISQGYSRFEVEKAIKKADEELANQAPILKAKPEIKYELVEPKIYQEKKSFWKRLFGK